MKKTAALFLALTLALALERRQKASDHHGVTFL